MSFPHLDRCSCGSPSSGSNKDSGKTKQANIIDVGIPAQQQTNKNDYRISPAKRRIATSSNFSNESAKISGARSQPSLRDENFKNLLSSGSNRSALIKRPHKFKAEDKRSIESSDCRNRNQSSTDADAVGIDDSTLISSAIDNVFRTADESDNKPQVTGNAGKHYECTKSAQMSGQRFKLPVQQSQQSRNASSSKPSLLDIIETTTTSDQNTQQPFTSGTVQNEPTSETRRQESTAQCPVDGETPNSTEYTPLSYDVNYVKVSPPRLTRRPKKFDENTDNNNNNSSNNNSHASSHSCGPLSRAQRLVVGKPAPEDKQNQKRTLKAPPRTPPEESKPEKGGQDKTNAPKVSLKTVAGSSKPFSGQSTVTPSPADEDEVLELTFTVLLEKGTLKRMNKVKGEDTNSATIKVKTENVKLDADSKRLVAESITEALKENAGFGNVSIVEVADTNREGPVGKSSQTSKKTNSNNTKANVNKHDPSGVSKSPMHDRNSLASKSFDCCDSKSSKFQEVAASYQSLDRKHTVQRDRRQLDGIKEAGSTIAEDEGAAKKYQALNNFSPLHGRLTTSAIIPRPGVHGTANDFKKNRMANLHSRYDSDVCDYETNEYKIRKMFAKPSFNINNPRVKGKYSSYHYGSSKDGSQAAEELTHMNWDDLMLEAKSLGIPLKRPEKMPSETDKDALKFSQGNITSRFLRNFVGKKAGLKLTKSICGGELSRTRDEYFNDLSSTSYQCPYETKKSSPFREKFRFVDLILGRSKSSKTLADDCPLCRQQQQQSQSNFLSRGKNLLKRSLSTNRGINMKQGASFKNPKCSKERCYDYGCTCYCTCKGKQGMDVKVLRSNSSPPPMSLKQNFCRKSGCSSKCYDSCCKEFRGSKTPKSGGRKMFDTFSLSDNYRSLFSPKKAPTRIFQPESSFCCQPYTPRGHQRHFKLLHLNSCGDDGGYDDDNEADDNRDDVFVDEVATAEVRKAKNETNFKRWPSKSVGFDSTDEPNKNQTSVHDKSISTSASKMNPNNSNGFLKSLHLLKNEGWYWGNMTFEKAEDVLNEMADGSFLVRDSSDDRYILSVSFRSQGKTHHTRIEHIQGVFSFYSQRTNYPGLAEAVPGDSTGSPSIVEFIEDAVRRSLQGENLYYLRESNDPSASPTPVRLLYPVERPSVPSLKESCVSLVGDVKA